MSEHQIREQHTYSVMYRYSALRNYYRYSEAFKKIFIWLNILKVWS